MIGEKPVLASRQTAWRAAADRKRRYWSAITAMLAHVPRPRWARQLAVLVTDKAVQRRLALLGLVLAITPALTIGIFVGSSSQLHRAEQEQKTARHVDAVVHDLTAAFAEIRHQSDTFAYRPSSAGAEDYHANVRRMQQQLARQTGFGDDFDRSIAALRVAVDAHEAAFDHCMSIWAEQGFDEEHGLQGDFRRHAHAMEKTLSRAGAPASLMLDYLQLRRHEKDFLQRRRPEYAAMTFAEAEALRRGLELAALPHSSKIEAQAHLADYLRAFRRLADLMPRHQEAFREEEHRNLAVQARLAELGTVRDRMVSQADDARRGESGLLRASAATLLFMIGCAAIILIVALALDLAKLAERARSLERMKSDFLSMVSHELRTPLNAILALSEIMERQLYGPLSGHYAESARDIHRSGRRLLGLIDDVLEITAFDGEISVTIQCPVAISAVVEKACQAVSEAARDRSVSIQHQVAPSFQVESDTDALARAVTKLLHNAVLHSPVGGTIELHVSQIDGTIRILIADQGSGIPDEWLEQVVQPFVQVSSGLTRTREGSGLGLTIAQRIVTRHGGRLDLANRDTGGLLACITLPARGEACSQQLSAETQKPLSACSV